MKIPPLDHFYFQAKPQERPIVLRKRRQRIRTTLNWPLFYYMFAKDHEKPDLIWNVKVKEKVLSRDKGRIFMRILLQTRQELESCLEGEIQSFVQDRELGSGALISWNWAEFEVGYASLAEEIRIGDYFLRYNNLIKFRCSDR